MSRLICVVAVMGALGLGLPGVARAHDGHTHTVVGTVLKVSPGQIEVQTRDGKAETVVMTDKTAVTRDTVPARLADVAVGDRVVIDVGTGSKPLKARSIRLGTAAPGSQGPKKAAPKPRPAS